MDSEAPSVSSEGKTHSCPDVCHLSPPDPAVNQSLPEPQQLFPDLLSSSP